MTTEERLETRERWAKRVIGDCFRSLNGRFRSMRNDLLRTLGDLDDAEARVAELERLVADARELVLATEWGSSGDTFCPGCGGWSDRGGHRPSCALAEFLTKTAPPPTVDIIGIAPDITGGLPSEEHVRRLRDDD